MRKASKLAITFYCISAFHKHRAASVNRIGFVFYLFHEEKLLRQFQELVVRFALCGYLIEPPYVRDNGHNKLLYLTEVSLTKLSVLFEASFASKWV